MEVKFLKTGGMFTTTRVQLDAKEKEAMFLNMLFGFVTVVEFKPRKPATLTTSEVFGSFIK